ncbi:hypothetical protein EDD90_6501 [Streptomyces sp. Ag109_O5-1]|uniref:hypothetical protein n=1 Tax=Streptomyces sp. Ag109_O5-1 TaxID=1938851 RepID=UPI000F4F23FF|nr:hypothetical protein [Streptomyces sp. Ag109_O5-1]RPE43305.1 hypothetical protein EDD90_6501 [Streptomyces sp. Ag109_O5-1]
MQGQGHAQPVQRPPHEAVLVLLRVVFVALGVFSLGLLTWVMMLRLAAVTRRSVDWGLLVAVAASDVLSFVLLGNEPGDDVNTTGGYLGITLLFGTLLATIVYYLVAEVRHFQRQRAAYAAQTYGYAPPASPYVTGTAPLGVQPPHTPPPHTPPPNTVPPMPGPPLSQPPIPAPPQRPAPVRIEQVRAELDELSDYLRKHDGHHEGNREGGR